MLNAGPWAGWPGTAGRIYDKESPAAPGLSEHGNGAGIADLECQNLKALHSRHVPRFR